MKCHLKLHIDITLHYILDCIDDCAVVKDFVACNEVQKTFLERGSVGHPMTKMLSASGGGLRPLTRGSAAGPRGPLQGALPQTPAVIGSCCALADCPQTTDSFPRLCRRYSFTFRHCEPLIFKIRVLGHMTQSFVGHGNKTTLGWKCYTRAAPSCDIFNLLFVIFHVPLTTVCQLLNVRFTQKVC